MPELLENELKKHLAENSLYPVYLIAGEEKYLVKRDAQRLIKRAGGDSFTEFNSQSFSNASSLDAISDAAAALPFFAERKCVSVSDFNIEEKDADTLNRVYELIENAPSSTVLVFWYPTLSFDAKKSAKWKKLVAEITRRGGVVFCERRSRSELIKMLTREAEKSGCTLSYREAERILDYAGTDVRTLLSETEKLCAYCLGRGENEITRQTVDELVTKTTETTAFLMTGALIAGDYEKAYKLLDRLFYQKEEPVAILGALSSSYIDMARVRAAIESGEKASDAARYGDYKGREFRLRNAEKNLKGISYPAVKKSLELLLDADTALKSSRAQPRLILEELIARLLLAAGGEKK